MEYLYFSSSKVLKTPQKYDYFICTTGCLLKNANRNLNNPHANKTIEGEFSKPQVATVEYATVTAKLYLAN